MGNFGREKRFDSRRSFSDNRSFGGRRDDRPRESFKAICDECGDECTLPFKPTGDKPVFCSNCFAKQGGGESRRDDRRDSGRRDDRRRDSGRRDDRDDREMFSVICDKCGAKSQVPFKPTPGKPILCDDCFRQNKNSGSRNSTTDYSEQFKSLNDKIEKLIKLLTPNSPIQKNSDKKELKEESKIKEEKKEVKEKSSKKKESKEEKKELKPKKLSAKKK